MMKILKVSTVKVLFITMLVLISYSGVSQAATKPLGSQVQQTVPQVTRVSTGIPVVLVGPRSYRRGRVVRRGPVHRARRLRGPARRRGRR